MSPLLKNKAALVTIAALLLGGFFSWLGSTLGASTNPWAALIGDLGTGLMSAAIFAWIVEIGLRHEFMQEILTTAHMSRNLSDAGATAIYKKLSEVPWEDVFRRTNSVVVISAGGRSWQTEQMDRLRNLLLKRGARIVFYLPDPENGAVVSELAIRFNESEEKTKSRIRQAESEALALNPKKTAKKARGGIVEVRYIDCSPTYAAYVFDNDLILTTYNHRQAKAHPPTLHIAKGGWAYDFYKEDLRCLGERSVSLE